jgi:DNA-binding transcriptional regulator YiaG
MRDIVAREGLQDSLFEYVSQLERGIKHPTGAALMLLNVIHRKGIEVIL